MLVGPSGCGKSTLLNTIAGLETITERRDPRSTARTINDLHPSKRDIAMVFQSYALYPNMTVGREHRLRHGDARRAEADEREKAVDEVAKMLQIEHLLDRKPSQLSGGQRQRVAMGRALVRDPQVFLFDEPLSNLDAKLRVDMRTEIKRLHPAAGTTIVYVTHDQIEAMTLATRIAVHEGRRGAAVRHAGRDLQQPGQPVRRRLHGLAGDEPDPGQRSARAATRCRVVLAARRRASRSRCRWPTRRRGCRPCQGKTIIFGIRPEALTDPDGADRNASNIADGRLP